MASLHLVQGGTWSAERNRDKEKENELNGERDWKRWVGRVVVESGSIWCRAAINKLYEKTRDVYLITEYLRNRNETHTLSHYC